MECNMFLYLGIGDVLLTKLHYDTISSKYSKIVLNTNLNIVNTLRSNDRSPKSYEIFIKRLISTLFENESKVYINYDYEHHMKQSIIGKYTYVHNDLSKYLTKYNEKFFINDPYIVISTKAVRVNISVYEKNKSHFLNLLENLSKRFKIILIGERNSSECSEYKTLEKKNTIHNMYNDFIKVPNIIDMSIDKDLCINVDFDNYQMDCYLISRALFSLHLGIGGLFVTSSVLCRTMCMYIVNKNYGHIVEMDTINKFKTVEISKSYEDFSGKIIKFDNTISNVDTIEHMIFDKYINRLYNDVNYIGNINIVTDNLNVNDIYTNIQNTFKLNILNVNIIDKNFSHPLIIVSNDSIFIDNMLNKTSYKDNLIVSNLSLNFENISTFEDLTLYISH